MKKICSIALGVVMLIFLSSFLSSLFGDSRTPGTRMAHQICAQIGKQLQAKYGLQYKGIYEEGPNGKYKCIGLDFNFDRILSKDEGRILLLNCTEHFLQTFNSRPQFKQYMANYPFKESNLYINIFIHPPKSYDVYYPNIAVFSLANDRLEYLTNSPEKRFAYFTEEEETLEEARKIVEEQREGKRPFIKSE